MSSLLDANPTAITSTFTQTDDELVRELAVGADVHRSVVSNPQPSGDGLGDWWRAYLRGERPRRLGEPRGSVRTVELFCGPGGLMLGFREAASELGLDVVPEVAVDQDATALSVYRRNHHPRFTTSTSVSMLVDYRVRGSRERARFAYDPEVLEPSIAALAGQVDVVLAGPPCEGHSNLNNHTRRGDLRNDLYLTVPAIAIALGAPTVVIENVPAVVHDDTGVVAATTTLLEAAGYHVEAGVLDASAMGWAQRRSRFFLVARKGRPPLSLGRVSEGLADDERSALWAFGDLVDQVDTSFMTQRPDLSEDNLRRIDWLFENDAHDLDLAERPVCHQEGTTYMSVYGRMYPDRAAQTITTGFMTPGRGRYVHPTQRRVITALEAARLQGFPDTYDFRPDPETEPSKGQLAKWIGDAVPMPLGFAASLAVLAGDG